MMIKGRSYFQVNIFVVFCFIISLIRVAAEDSVALKIMPTALIPIAESSDYFTTGIGGSFDVEYKLLDSSWSISAGAAFNHIPIVNSESLTLTSTDLGAGYSLDLSNRLSLIASIGGGYSYSFLNQGEAVSSSAAVFGAGLCINWMVNPIIDLGIKASYRNYLGLYHGVSVSLLTSYYISGRDTRKNTIDSSNMLQPGLLIGAKADRPNFGLDIEKIELCDLFPVFKSYYDDHPLGTVLIVNKSKKPISEIKLSFFSKQYMDSPKECKVPAILESGEKYTAELSALFTEAILAITESTKAQSELSIEYRYDGELYRSISNPTLRFLDRNAMRWDDDRRAAAFVTAKDPVVLSFSKNAVGLVRDQGPKIFDSSFLFAMALFKTMDLYGISYVVDPKSSYSDNSSDRTLVDYLQFPRQTLEYKAGDCDDLSILYAALLESVGIECAFITVPGHIFVAFALDTKPSEIHRSFSNLDDLIIANERVWVPVEVTVRKDGFVRAWSEAARQWREEKRRGSAALIPIHEAWTEYEPVGLGADKLDIQMPTDDQILAAFTQESDRLLNRELGPKIALIEEELRKNQGTPSLRNKLGVLYAQCGKMDLAEEQFIGVLGRSEYKPAMVNLGNIHFLKKRYTEAQRFYIRAIKVEPGDSSLLLNLARTYFEQDLFDMAKQAYEELLKKDRASAEKFAYLGDGSRTNRADVGISNIESVVWREE